MHCRRARARIVASLAATVLLVTGGCSSTSTTVTSPTSVRCPVELTSSSTNIGASGGSGQIGVSVNRDCTWEARSEASWITLVPPTSGQGEASLTYTVSSNDVVAERRGMVTVNDQRVEISQAAAACRYDLSAAEGTAPPSGGSLAVTVAAQPSCAWTAVSRVSWVHIDAGREGDGQGVVSMSVAPNTGATREGSVVIADRVYAVVQPGTTPPTPPPPGPPTPPPPPPACSFNVSPTAESIGAEGGSANIQVRASDSSCSWTAVSHVPWIALDTAAGTGNGHVRYVVASNGGAARSGTLSVAATTVTVTQSAAPAPPPPPPPPVCEFTVSPDSESFRARGGDARIRVRASDSSCVWTAESTVPWIRITEADGRGNGEVRYEVAENDGPARTATLRVAATTVTITQEGVESASTMLRGAIADLAGRCPSLSFDLDGSSVLTDEATNFDRSCQRLRSGRDATVWGVEQEDSSVLALRVREGR